MEKRLEHIRDTLLTCVEKQLLSLDDVDAEELGEVVDMVKDMEEAIYYCTVTKAMKNYKDEGEQHYPMSMRDMDRDMGRMYYDEQPSSSQGHGNKQSVNNGTNHSGNYNSSGMTNNSSNRPSTDMEYPLMRDQREGRSPVSRKMYMEHKETHADKTVQMRELETYMQELTQDIVEMIEGASQEEKQYLSKRVAALANKIV